jgi:hypothetical protein
LGGQGEPVPAAAAIDAEFGCALERPRRRRLGAAGEAEHSGGLQLGRQPLVRAFGHDRPVPRTAGRVRGDRGQRLVGRPAIVAGGRAVHR